MLSRRALVVIGCLLLALVAAPAAEARAAKHARLASLRSVPASVDAGKRFRVRGRVTHLPRKHAVKLVFTLRKTAKAKRFFVLRTQRLRRPKHGGSRRFSLRIAIPREVRAGRYTFRACVRKSCRSRRLRVTDRPTPGPGPGPAPGPQPESLAKHSLRAPLTGENFYFVMADRFANGDTANDRGGIAGDDREVTGFDPTAKGYFHGGDLEGLRSKLGYIKGLGTTAIWLTPSFKNRPVQGEGANRSAGYHGYWVTDFTQIDPHFGTNEELRRLIQDAHGRGMKVFFDIITNHTADVLGYAENQYTYVSKDREPYRDAAGRPFDDRDFAGTNTFPATDPATSFPYTPVNNTGIEKVPAWLNNPAMYHNRGDTTFTGEDSQYGDFFGLDDLFTERPEVVDGMVDIYDTWVKNMRIDGFRIDTMKHVNDEFWQKFSPSVLDYAKRQRIPRFFMFGEVADSTRLLTSHYTTHNDVQAVLDFPFQDAARSFASKSAPTDSLRTFFRDDDYYTDGDSNVYQLPTFLGNHDQGHIGGFLRDDNPAGTPESELLARDRLAHELMYFSRGNPVVYFGDEQGFTGAGGDQAARQDMFPSQDLEYDNEGDDAGKNDDIGSDATPMDDNFDPQHPLYKEIARLAKLTREHPALRDGAQQHRYSSAEAGIYAFSRISRDEQREYVVALNNAETPKTATIPTYMASSRFDRLFGDGPAALTSDADRGLEVTVPALSAVVYEAAHKLPRSDEAPSVAIVNPPHNGEGRERMEVTADLGGDSFYEVTFYAKVGDGPWHDIGTDDNAPYRAFHDIWDVEPGTHIQYKAVVLDNAGHARESAVRTARVAKPSVSLQVRSGSPTELRVTTVPERSNYVVTVQRKVGDGDWEKVGSDDSSPVYTVFDDQAGVPAGATVAYRAILDYGSGTATSPEPRPLTTSIVHYHRDAGDYADWGLHLWGDAIAPGVATTWDVPRPRDGTDDYGAVFHIPVQDESKPVNFIVHRPSGDSVPSTREPGGDRSFVPADHNEIWLKQGDPNVYFAEPPLP